MESWCVTVISRGALSTNVNTTPFGNRAIGRYDDSALHIRLALEIATWLAAGLSTGTNRTANGTSAPRPITASRTVPATRTTGHRVALIHGPRIHKMEIAPTTLSICAAGPVRVCQKRST